MKNKVNDLRSALALLEELPGQLVTTDVEVDPMAQLAGVYRYVGAGGTVARPTKEGPAMIFNNIKGHPGACQYPRLRRPIHYPGHVLCHPPGYGSP